MEPIQVGSRRRSEESAARGQARVGVGRQQAPGSSDRLEGALGRGSGPHPSRARGPRSPACNRATCPPRLRASSLRQVRRQHVDHIPQDEEGRVLRAVRLHEDLLQRRNPLWEPPDRIGEESVVAIVRALKTRLAGPHAIERFTARFRDRVVEHSKPREAGDDAQRLVRDCERRIANLTESLAKLGWSEAIAAKLREEEAELSRLKLARKSPAVKKAGRTLPSPTVIASYLQNLFTLLETDPARGRELLARYVGSITMTPEGEGPARRYRATGAFNLSLLLGASSSAANKSSCAGPQLDFPAQQDQGVAQVWVPFEESIAVGW